MDNNLSILMGKKMVNISKVSRDTGISRTTLTNLYYKRNKSISGVVINKLCEYFGVTFTQFFTTESEV